MALINDSNAIEDIRILPQHQSALTLLQSKLQNPKLKEVFWLDLACGKGQIVSQLEENISQALRKKINYVGYDIKIEYTTFAEKNIEKCELKNHKFKTGELSDYPSLINTKEKFDFITFTNTAHEIFPTVFSEIIYESILRLSNTGELFIYDMESLTSPELGALPWTVGEIEELISTLLNSIGSSLEAHPNGWQHSKVKGWTLNIQREYLGVDDKTLIKLKSSTIDAMNEKIILIIDNRYKRCKAVLNALCKYGSDTGSEEQEKISALYEFWALSNARGMIK